MQENIIRLGGSDMNQEKIGTFIANARKEQGVSQKDLADAIGVTDKAVSKWECGKSMPEISKMETLCEVLHVNINELLSGERLSEAAYPQKAEENMINLIHESESKASQTNSVGIIVMIVLSFLPIVFSILYGRMSYFDGSTSFMVWLDPPTVTVMVVVTILYLIGTKSTKAFRRAFAIVSSTQWYSDAQIKDSYIAVKMVRISWLITGILVSVLGYVSTAIDVAGNYSAQDRYVIMILNYAVSSLGIIYGLVGYLILTPVKAKLESALSKSRL